ncbi:MAG: O-antigen ligase family protein [Bryobacteraceae bacterium]
MTDPDSAKAAATGSSRLAAALALLLFYGVLTIWVRNRWALSLLQAGVLLSAAVWILGWARRPSNIQTAPLLLPLACAPLWGLLQLALGTTVYPFDTWEEVLFWFSILAAVFLALQALADGVVRARFLTALLFFGVAISVLGTIQLFTSKGKIFWLFDSGYPDAFGPFVYYNNYAAFAELLLPLAIYRGLRDRRHGADYAILAGVIYASVIASNSRAGSVLCTALLVAVPAVAALRKACDSRRLLLTTAALVGAAALFTAVVGWSRLLERLRHPDPFVHRREMLLSSLEMGKDRPWMGFGLGTYQEAYPTYALFDIGLIVNHAHNDWAEWLAEGGVPFLVITIGFAALTVGPALRSVWGIGLISVYLHALVDYPMQRLGLALWIFVLAAAVTAAARERRRLATP